VTAGGRGFPVGQPWVAFYGSPTSDLDLTKLAATFRIIDLDADPDVGFTTSQIAQLRSSGQNRVISYLDVGSCESFRSYYATDPPGHKSCQNSGALTGPYAGFNDEMWADLSNASYQDLIVNYVAPRLAAQGVDGFFLDNMEVVEHGLAPSQGGPCGPTCSQGGLDLIWQLRQKFPDKLLVLQNAVSATTRMGTTNGVAFPTLLDGLSVESLFADGSTVSTDTGTLNDVLAWGALGLMPGNRPFWLGAEDYVGSCSATNKPTATTIYALASAAGLNEYVTDMSGLQHAPCYWSDFP
jgi:cysteinyl-tRNA synthetase